jgi:hypothetical protein
VLRNRKPLKAPKALTAMTVAPENGVLRKKRRSRSGSARRGSYQQRATTAAAQMAKRERISVEVQPWVGPSMME